MRTVLVFLVLALLLHPVLRSYKQSVSPPVAVILLDDSESVLLGTRPDSLKKLFLNVKLLKTKLEEAGTEVYLQTFNFKTPEDSVVYSGRSTNLDAVLTKLQGDFDNQNLTDIYLASDGIVNVGADPSTRNFPFRINTIRTGDPTIRRDISISEVRLNKIAFTGNTFPVQVQVRGRQIARQPLEVKILENGKVLMAKSISLPNSGIADVLFELKAGRKGMHQYLVEVSPVAGEVTTRNNQRNIFIEVVDEKQRVLIASSSPHPDVKAIREALSGIDQIEVTTIIGGKDAWKGGAWNLVILHQLPDRQGTFGPEVGQLLKGNTAVFVVTGSQTDFNRLRSQAGSWLQVQTGGNAFEEMGGSFSPDFQRYTYSDKWKKVIESLPPLISPVNGYKFKGLAETILNQRLGKSVTPTPLLALDLGNQPKRGIFWGEGLWLWRQNEYASNQNFEATDNLIQKTIQLLLSADKKQRLKIQLAQTELFDNEQATFMAETYNQIFEPLYDQKIDLSIVRQDGKRLDYSFFNSASRNSFSTAALAAGTYKYTAKAVIGGKTESDMGEFQVKPNELEAQELQANHRLLLDLAQQTGGKSSGIMNMESIVPLEDESPKASIEFIESDDPILNFPLVLVLLLVLACSEWAIRKWNGAL